MKTDTDKHREVIRQMNTPTKPTPTQRVEQEVHGWDIKTGQRVVTYEFASFLATELESAQEKLDEYKMTERCIKCNHLWNPSWVESGWCIHCIAKDLRSKLDAYENLPDSLEMKTAEDWIKSGHKVYPTSGDFVKAIQLDAMKEGMRRAAEVIYQKPVKHKHLQCVPELSQAILSSAEQLTLNDL